jgi:hypothetical protein
MSHKIIYNAEFPDGKEVELTAEEETAREERAIVVAKEIEDHNNKIEQQKTDKASGNQKLKDLGLTDDEIAALVG